MLGEQSRELEIERYAILFNAFDIRPGHEQEYRDPKEREETLDSTRRPASHHFRRQSVYPAPLGKEYCTTHPKLICARRCVIGIEVACTRGKSDCGSEFLCRLRTEWF